MLTNIVTNWHSAGVLLSISAIITFIISTMKNSILRKYIWDKLGSAQIFLAPVLALIGFAFTVTPFSAKTVVMAIVTGAGATYLANLLKAIRGISGLGTVWCQILDFFGGLLGKPSESLLSNRK